MIFRFLGYCLLLPGFLLAGFSACDASTAVYPGSCLLFTVPAMLSVLLLTPVFFKMFQKEKFRFIHLILSVWGMECCALLSFVFRGTSAGIFLPAFLLLFCVWILLLFPGIYGLTGRIGYIVSYLAGILFVPPYFFFIRKNAEIAAGVIAGAFAAFLLCLTAGFLYGSKRKPERVTCFVSLVIVIAIFILMPTIMDSIRFRLIPETAVRESVAAERNTDFSENAQEPILTNLLAAAVSSVQFPKNDLKIKVFPASGIKMGLEIFFPEKNILSDGKDIADIGLLFLTEIKFPQDGFLTEHFLSSTKKELTKDGVLVLILPPGFSPDLRQKAIHHLGAVLCRHYKCVYAVPKPHMLLASDRDLETDPEKLDKRAETLILNQRRLPDGFFSIVIPEIGKSRRISMGMMEKNVLPLPFLIRSSIFTGMKEELFTYYCFFAQFIRKNVIWLTAVFLLFYFTIRYFFSSGTGSKRLFHLYERTFSFSGLSLSALFCMPQLWAKNIFVLYLILPWILCGLTCFFFRKNSFPVKMQRTGGILAFLMPGFLAVVLIVSSAYTGNLIPLLLSADGIFYGWLFAEDFCGITEEKLPGMTCAWAAGILSAVLFVFPFAYSNGILLLPVLAGLTFLRLPALRKL